MTDKSAVNQRLVISRVIAASRDKVFRKWTQPEELRRWWGPGGFTCPEAQIDLRPGGTYRLVMQPPAGEQMVLTGTYREVSPPELLVYTWRWEIGPPASGAESLVTVEFHEHGAKTEVVITHDRFPADHDLTQYRSGWEEGLEKLGNSNPTEEL
jgi:uncharacterized protein YndB with AHSA1/START domain